MRHALVLVNEEAVLLESEETSVWIGRGFSGVLSGVLKGTPGSIVVCSTVRRVP